MSINEVFILGEKLTIKGDAPEARVREITKFINGRIDEILEKYPTLPSKKTLILTLFNIVEELYITRESQETITRDINEKAELLASLLD